MSAFVVDHQSIDYILSHWRKGQVFFSGPLREYLYKIEHEKELYLLNKDGELLSDHLNIVKNILYQENIRSVNFRYPDCSQTALVTPKFKNVIDTELFQAIKSLDCLAYQSSECPNWGESIARQFIKKIERDLIRNSEGYKLAEWR